MRMQKIVPRTERDICAQNSLNDAQRMVDEAMLITRWQGQARHVVLDTHFDDGARFLATWRAWCDDPQRSTQLHYVAIENRPYSAEALAASHAQWPQVAKQAQQLREVWPLPLAGFHRIWFAGNAVCLTLIFGDLAASITQIDAQIDTFMLDTNTVAVLSDSSSFRLLAACGRMAAKDALLCAASTLPGDPSAWRNSGFLFAPDENTRLARFAPRWQVVAQHYASREQRHAIVIGAGLAGSAAAERLCARDWRVTLIDRHQQVAQEASGNHAGIFMPTLAKDDNPAARLTRAAFLYALRLWQCVGGIGQAFAGEASGVLQLARDMTRIKTAQEIAENQYLPPEYARWLDRDGIASMPGMAEVAASLPPDDGGWLFSQGGWFNPAGACHALLTACADKLDTHFNIDIAHIERVDDTWKVFDRSGALIATAPVLILANGAGACSYAQAADLPLMRIRGQVTHIPAERLPQVPMVLCREGYLTRPYDGLCSLGASYDVDDDDSALRWSSQHENLQRLNQLLPGHTQELLDLPLTGRVGFRCVSSDRLPLIGALPDLTAGAHFHGERLRDVPRLPQLYGLLAYASRGLIWAPLAAEVVAAQICGEPMPIERDLLATLDPARFLLTEHRRRSR